jgi:non-specific protein-tyrosine kinase
MNTDDTSNFSLELQRYVALIWHWSWLLILITVIAGGTAFLVSKNMTPVYQASTLLLINEAPLNQAANYSSLTTSERLAQTYAQMMTTRPVLEAVAESLMIDEAYLDTIQEEIRVQTVPNTSLLRVFVTDPNPILAADVANKLVEVFAQQNLADQASRYVASKQSLEEQMVQIDEQIESTNQQLTILENIPDNQATRDQLSQTLSQYRQTYAVLSQSYEEIRLAEAQSLSNIIQKETAVPPTIPIRPQVGRNTIMGMVVGLMLGVGLVFLIEMLDTSLKDPQEVTRRFGLPILGMIASHTPAEGQLIAKAEPRSQVAEAFRGLRTNLQYTSVDRPLHTLLITSPSPDDGKSTIAANLGIVLAQSGKRVALVDADLRRPVQHKLLRLANRRGLSQLFITPEIHLNGNLQKTDVEFLSAVTAGQTPPNPADLLGSETMIRILDQLLGSTDMVVIDSPPVMAVTDALVLAPRVDGVLLVVKPSTTDLPTLQRSIEQLRQVGANILGVVLNDVEITRSGYHNYYYRSAYQRTYHYNYTATEPVVPEKRADLREIGRRMWKSIQENWKSFFKG